MVGFILIIVIVVVIGLFFAFIFFRQKPTTIPSKEVESFLNAISYYTTDCSFSLDENYNIKELIKACYKGEKCEDGRNSCDVLNESIYNLIKSSFKIGKEGKYIGFKFNIYIGNSSLLKIEEGLKSDNLVGAEIFFPSQLDNIKMRLELYTKI